jgi:uncharacterized protein (DUF427 family)
MWNYNDPFEDCIDVSGLVAFYWNKADAWFEEDEEVFFNPKDPYRRVDYLQSSRNVRVELNGETLAETTQPVLVIETGLPCRYYIPKQDVRQEFLQPSEKVMGSQYKGEASYYSFSIGEEVVGDLAWYYRFPYPEAAKIANHVCFPQGKVDLYIDGELQEKPHSRWD